MLNIGEATLHGAVSLDAAKTAIRRSSDFDNATKATLLCQTLLVGELTARWKRYLGLVNNRLRTATQAEIDDAHDDWRAIAEVISETTVNLPAA